MTAAELKAKLEACKSPQEMLELILKTYDLNLSLGMVTKNTFINGLMMAIAMLRPKLKP